jgi:2-hydroxychromene-2-carboxylate isomerase
MNETPLLYFDLASPYAYLALARAPGVLGVRPRAAPIVLGPVFAHRGSGSWALTDARAANVAEIERRAAEYGLPALRWPEQWPAHSLHVMRVAVWADQLGRGYEFALAASHASFAEAADLTDHAALIQIARVAGLPERELESAIAQPELKADLKRRTDEAIARGVVGVPTLDVAGRLFYGDDELPAAARVLAPAR